jgi:glycosyltransferase involved in cell wall biosynthesis
MKISIVTPSYNMLGFLRICCNSISDQNVDYEHIIVDGSSQDGTAEWLKKKPGIISISEKDQGMYDAINKGIKLSKGEIISYLNCDEQYLPGVLLKVNEFFQHNPKIDILFGNALIIKPNGALLAYRKSFIPRWYYIWASHMYVHSSSMFVRRKVFESGFTFNQNWKTIGDADFLVKLLRNGFKVQHVNQYFSAFMLTGSNLGSGELAMLEIKSFREQAPFWISHSTALASQLIRFEKFIHGAYWEKKPLAYSVYTLEQPDIRSSFVEKTASPLYPLGNK